MDFSKLRSLQELRMLIRAAAATSEQLIGMRPSEFRLKPMRTQWGSCNSRGAIALNTRLMYLPDRLVAYVVHHEITHLKIKNHGPDFRRHIELLFPDRIAINKQMKAYSHVIRN